MKNLPYLKNCITAGIILSAFSAQAANTFTNFVFDPSTNGTTSPTNFLVPNFQETNTIVSDSTMGKINFDMQQSNVGPAFSAGTNPGAYLEYTVHGGGTIDLKVTEITGWNQNPYRFDFETSGNVTAIDWHIQFETGFKSLAGASNNIYAIAARALVDPNGDGVAQNFTNTLSVFDEALAQIDLAAQPNLETPFLNFGGDGLHAATVISHTDTTFTELLPDGSFQAAGASRTGGNGLTLTEQVLANGWGSTGNGIKSLDSTDRQAASFGAFSGTLAADGQASLEEGTVFALTMNGTFTDQSPDVIPEPASFVLITCGFSLITLRRKRG